MVSLRESSEHDEFEIYEMLKEIGPGENGFINGGYDISFEEFPRYLKSQVDASNGIGLKPEHVPQTIYWLYIDNKPVGVGKLRAYLNEDLKKLGGHIGYCIRPSERGKGYGNIILKELLGKAEIKGISEVLLTCKETNILSRKVIEANGGLLDKVSDNECYYWIKV